MRDAGTLSAQARAVRGFRKTSANDRRLRLLLVGARSRISWGGAMGLADGTILAECQLLCCVTTIGSLCLNCQRARSHSLIRNEIGRAMAPQRSRQRCAASRHDRRRVRAHPPDGRSCAGYPDATNVTGEPSVGQARLVPLHPPQPTLRVGSDDRLGALAPPTRSTFCSSSEVVPNWANLNRRHARHRMLCCNRDCILKTVRLD